ncbi:UNVERIFIED_CONTAM: hypothetical protein GTU68_050597 [Idotea baltica]|nr:hypothetical protein [Idotea baltica]
MSQLSPEPINIDGSSFRFGIVAARFNQVFVDGLVEGARSVLLAAGVADDAVVFERVPGSNELPLAAKLMAETKEFDGIIALGAIIKGGTRHYEMVADGSNFGLHRVALDTGIPIVNGVIVGDTESDVRERCIGSIPKGKEFGECALEMAELRRRYL